MLKIQHGIAGFFAGAFTGLLLSLLEMRMIDNAKHPAMLFIVNSITVIACGIAGMAKGLRIADKKIKTQK